MQRIHRPATRRRSTGRPANARDWHLAEAPLATREGCLRLQSGFEKPSDGVLVRSRARENQRVETRGAMPAVGAVSGGNGLSGKRAR
jgi:hypothetical protein